MLERLCSIVNCRYSPFSLISTPRASGATIIPKPDGLGKRQPTRGVLVRLDQSADRRSMARSDDRAALPVAGLCAVHGPGRAVVRQHRLLEPLLRVA